NGRARSDLRRRAGRLHRQPGRVPRRPPDAVAGRRTGAVRQNPGPDSFRPGAGLGRYAGRQRIARARMAGIGGRSLMAPKPPARRVLAAICRPAGLAVVLGALLAAGIVAAPGMLPETQAVLVRRTLVDLPAAALA